MTSLAAVSEAVIQMKSLHMTKSRLGKEKSENTEIKEFLQKTPSKRCRRNVIHEILMRTYARGNADIILPYVMLVATLRVKLIVMRRKLGHAKNV